MINDASDATMVRTIIIMAKSLHLHLITEGEETIEQAVFLLQAGCERAQDYYYRRPVAAEEFVRLLQLGLEIPKHDLPLTEQINLKELTVNQQPR